jgi:hypothetical protein
MGEVPEHWLVSSGVNSGFIIAFDIGSAIRLIVIATFLSAHR